MMKALAFSLVLSTTLLANSSPQVLVPNGGWCWFQGERAILVGDTVVFGTVKSPQGDIDVHSWKPATGAVASFTLAAHHESDDHDAPALLALPDGRLLASWGNHGAAKPKEHNQRLWWRVSAEPGSIAAWAPVQSLAHPGNLSYTNLHRLEDEGGRIYNFSRSTGFNPNYTVSDDNGRTFRYGGRLLFWPPPAKSDPKLARATGGGRPYVKYASNGRDTIHFVATEDHPGAYQNSLYHGFYRAGALHASDGRPLGPLSRTNTTTLRPTDLTPVYRGDPDHVPWPVDLHLDAHGRPVTLFSVQVNGAASQNQREASGLELRYFYARHDGTRWIVHPLAAAGTELYPVESDYSGLAALVPHDPARVFISTNADPVSGRPLVSSADGRRHHELFAGVTTDGGATWTWTAVTHDSRVDNLRPVIPAGQPGVAVLLWLQGTLRTYRDYDLSVVGLVHRSRAP